MLLGMLTSAPQRAAIYGGEPLPSPSQIEARARTCAALFLKGCRAGADNIGDRADMAAGGIGAGLQGCRTAG
jgi:hypothetical protein